MEKINARAFINIAPSCQPLEKVFNGFLNISNYGIFFIVITDLFIFLLPTENKTPKDYFYSASTGPVLSYENGAMV